MKRRTDLLILLGFLIVSPMSLMGGCGGDGDDNMGPGDPFLIPAAWQGVWETSTVTRDCEGNLLDDDLTEDHLCEGKAFSYADEGFSIECTGTGNDTSFEITCTSSFVVDGCTVNVTVTISGTRNGDTYTADGHVEGTVTGDCGKIENFCQDLEVTGTRTGATPDCSSTTRGFVEGFAARAVERAQSQ